MVVIVQAHAGGGGEEMEKEKDGGRKWIEMIRFRRVWPHQGILHTAPKIRLN